MTVLSANPKTLDAQLVAAKAGDEIHLEAGAWGDVYIRKAVVGGVVTITADPAAVLRSLNVNGSAGLSFQGLTVRFTPDAKTVGWSAALTVSGSHDITFTRSSVIGGPAINGVVETATALDNTANVIGRPAGYGFSVLQSQNISFTDGEIATAHRLVVLNNVDGFVLRNNWLHNRRTTAVQGAQVLNALVENNSIQDAQPWRWGLPNGDHADCMAFWSSASQTTANDNIRILNNWMEQSSGATILGMWFQGTDAAPFTNFQIVGNTFLIPNLQGVLLTGSKGGLIAGNTFLQTQVAGMTDEQRQKQRPTILLRAGVSGVTMTGNRVSAPISDLSGGVNSVSGTVLLAGSFLAPGGPVAVDTRDAQIAALQASLGVANDTLTAAQAWIAKVRAVVMP